MKSKYDLKVLTFPHDKNQYYLIKAEVVCLGLEPMMCLGLEPVMCMVLEPGWQDGRRRQIHWAMAAPQYDFKLLYSYQLDARLHERFSWLLFSSKVFRSTQQLEIKVKQSRMNTVVIKFTWGRLKYYNVRDALFIYYISLNIYISIGNIGACCKMQNSLLS